MFQKQPFTRPQTIESHSRSKAKTVKQIDISRSTTKDACSIPKVQLCEKKSFEDAMEPQKYYTAPFLSSQPIHTKRFALSLQDQLIDNDPYCLWKFKIGNPFYGKLQRTILIQDVNFIINGWTSDNFPFAYALNIDGVAGYYDSYGDPTDVVAWLDIDQINSTQINEMPLYDIQYKLKKPIQWTIPKQVTELNFRISLLGEHVKTPLKNPVTLRFTLDEK